MTLHLVPDAPVDAMPAEELPACRGCNTGLRPNGTTELEYPGTRPVWGDNQCRICDYLACGKDPEDRFIPASRVNYLTGLRNCLETERSRRGVPATGSRAGRLPLTELLSQISQDPS